MPRRPSSVSSIESLEARIAPAVVINNPIPDYLGGIGTTSTTVDLSQLTAGASSSAYHTRVQFITNFDTDLTTPGIQAGIIEIELFDDVAPLTVQNFLAYVNNANAKGDYDNTLIHRAAFNGDGSPYVLQGGGYDASTLAHISVFPTVHNEYGLSNLTGTVAMAKLPGNPNSATSEWFINLNNNTQLDDDGPDPDVANGGFTVFGQVDANSLAVANAIAALLGTGDGLPLQNGVPIKIVSAKVIPGTPAPTTGLTYTIESVTPVDGSPANLVTTKITGSTLKLSYKGTTAGIVDVTVKVSDGIDSTTDTFRVTLLPNFEQTTLIGDTLPGWLLPGDTGTAKFSIANSGGVTGTGTINVFLQEITVTKNSLGVITAINDVTSSTPISIGTANFSVGSGRFATVSVPVKAPTDPFENVETYYRVFATVVPSDLPTTTDELFSDDNGSSGTSIHDAVTKFGNLFDLNFGGRNAVLKYTTTSTDAKPATVTWKITGAGVGTVAFDGAGDEASLLVEGTTFASTVTATLSKNAERLGFEQIDFSNPIGTANLASIDLAGPLSASGGIKTLKLGDATGQALFSIGAPLLNPSLKAALTLRNVENISIESGQLLASLTVARWEDTDLVNDLILAPALGKLAVTGTGDFEADITLTDSRATLTSIAIGGFLRDAKILAAGNIGTVKVGGIDSSSVFAGVTTRPTALGDFADPFKIASFTVTGIKGLAATEPLFIDSQVAAQTIGTITVKNVDTTNGGAAETGFVADVINRYTRTGTPAKTKLTAPGTLDDEIDGAGDYLVRIL